MHGIAVDVEDDDIRVPDGGQDIRLSDFAGGAHVRDLDGVNLKDKDGILAGRMAGRQTVVAHIAGDLDHAHPIGPRLGDHLRAAGNGLGVVVVGMGVAGDHRSGRDVLGEGGQAVGPR